MRSDGTAEAGEEFEPELKLHRSSWIFGVANYLKSFLVPLIAATVIGSSGEFAIWAPVIVIVPLIGAALWQQWVYRYGFSANGLVIHEGLIFRNVRRIDYARIENVDTERGLLHRALGVAEVRIETSTGGSAEARIRVLDLGAVDGMRARIFARDRGGDAAADSTGAASTAPRKETLLELPPAELVRFGLIDNRGMLVVAAVMGLLAQGGVFENTQEWAGPLLARLRWETLAAFGLAAQLLLPIALGAALIVSTRALSILLAFAMLFDFKLTRTGGDLHARYGLLTRISMTLRRRRIQAVHQTATLLHRLFHRVSLKVDLAGGLTAGNEAARQGAQQHFRDLWLAPLVPPEAAEDLIRVALPQVRLQGLDWQKLAPRARWRIFRVLSLTWLIVGSVPAAWWAGWWAAALLPAPLPVFWLHASLYVKHTGWALHEEFFALRRGWLTRRLALTPRNRIQSVRLRTSPFDRRYRMARLDVDIAGVSAVTHRFAVSHLDHRDAERLAAHLVGSRQTQ